MLKNHNGSLAISLVTTGTYLACLDVNILIIAT